MATVEQQTNRQRPESNTKGDVHSYSNPSQVRVTHLDLVLEVDFDKKELSGQVTLDLKRDSQDARLILDTMALDIRKVEVSKGESDFVATTWSQGDSDPIKGSPLTIDVVNGDRVRIEYSTSMGAKALQWLEPVQTSGKRRPFMFTQSQPIYARSWIPLQDSPQVRFTYSALVKTRRDLWVVMAAANNPTKPGTGEYRFEMPQPIPSYLVAMAVGDLDFRSLGPRSGVYAEPSVIDRAAAEFSDIEKMIMAAEELYGSYRWDRYDMLMLPPSFPLGGMENPRLTFLTPTVIAGDKSLVSLIAHELAHAWSGNLVTNATWSDFWLNEGITTYVERRIVEQLYGRPREEMESVLAYDFLQKEMTTLDANGQALHPNLEGCDPDDAATKVPYDKGALFLRQIEEVFGRNNFDHFLKMYFERFAFKSITTDGFIHFLKEELLASDPGLAAGIPIDEWLYKAGLPASSPRPRSGVFLRVIEKSKQWLDDSISSADLEARNWTTHEWLYFLRSLPKDLDQAKMRDLDRAFNLTNTGNSEIAHEWLLLAIRTRYDSASQRLESYLQSIGREKLIKPLYEELIKSADGLQFATRIYEKARPFYHPIVVEKIDRLLRP
jgi:leukotriene A-4 hydrolase/aminopeptidase